MPDQTSTPISNQTPIQSTPSADSTPLVTVTAPAAEKQPLIWTNILFMTLNPLAAAILTPIYLHYHGITWGLVAFLGITYTISNMVITTGYHRYFSHRTYNVHPVVEWLYVFVGSGAFQGSVLAWSTDHRRHHLEVDSHDDPYSRSKGFWYSHFFWLFRESDHPKANAYPKDLTKSKFIVWQHKHYALIATFVGYFIPALIGYACGLGFWGGAIIGGSLRIALSQHSTFLINSAAHTFGSRPYTDVNSARDSFVMAFLTFGEGYHNYHHFFQADYRNGIRWYQWDPTKWWIKALAAVGLATKLKKARKEEIFKARFAMEEKLVLEHIKKNSGHHFATLSERAAQLKIRITEAQMKLRHLHDDYLQAKKNFGEKRAQMSADVRAAMHAKLESMKKARRAELKVAKIEFKSAYSQWRTFRKDIRRTAA
jgi:stearoyl-CoA desaturase (delta-9 desaturase)